MSKRRLVITAVLVEKRDVKEVMAAYAISKSWLYELVALYRAEGEAAFEARSKRPKTSPNATPPGTVDLVRRLRKERPSRAWTPARRPSCGTCPATTA